MPYGLAVRLGLCAGLLLLFPATASLQQKTDWSHPASPTTSARSDDQIVINTDLISLNVSVTDKSGRPICGLPRKAFTVLDEKKPQEILFFADDDSPISVGIVFDLTGSMTDRKIRRAREALSHFIETSHNQDEFYLITLRAGAAFLSQDKTRDGDAVVDVLRHVAPSGSTAFYDGCYLALNKVLEDTHQRRALLLISDGQDNNSHYNLSELRRMLKESDVTVYSIGVDDEAPGSPGEKVLREIAENTGGRFFNPVTTEGMYETFEQIALELRHQYSISYKPSDFIANGKWRRVKVKIDPPFGAAQMFIRNRPGYYAWVTR
jgi:Ca-activated chloride channel family protein